MNGSHPGLLFDDSWKDNSYISPKVILGHQDLLALENADHVAPYQMSLIAIASHYVQKKF